MAIISTDNLIKQGGAFFTQNFRRSNLGGVVNGYSSEAKNYGTNGGDDWGSSIGTPIIEDYLHMVTEQYNVPFTIYKGQYTGAFGVMLEDSGKVLYEAGASGADYGIIQDTYGNVVWANSYGMGKITQALGAIEEHSSDLAIYIEGGNTIDYTGSYVGAITFSVSVYGKISAQLEYILIMQKIEDDQWGALYHFAGERWNTKSLLKKGDTVELLIFDPNWKNKGYGNWKAMLQFEDAQFICKNDGTIHKWKESDASDFKEALRIPYGYDIIRLVKAKTSSGDKIFILANKNKRGTVFVWDGASETYDYSIDFDEPISTGIENYVAVDTGIYYTNGYDKQLVTSIPGLDRKPATKPIKIADIRVHNDYLFFTSNVENSNPLYKRGLYVYDLVNEDLTYIMPYDNHWLNMKFGAVIIEDERQIYFSHNYQISKLLPIPARSGNIYQFLFNPENSRMLKLSEMYLNIDFGMYEGTQHFNDLDFDIIIRCYDFKEPFSYRVQDDKSSYEDDLPLNKISTNYSSKGYYKADITGFKIEFLGGNSSRSYYHLGEARNIISSKLGGKYGYDILTLDEPLEQHDNIGGKIMITPLKKIGYKKIEGQRIADGKLKIPLLTQPMFKKALFEIEFRFPYTYGTTAIPKINSVELILEQNDL